MNIETEQHAEPTFDQAAASPGIRVILADSQAIYRVGMRKVFALEDDIRVVAQAENLANLHAALQRYPTDDRLPQLTFLMAASYRKSASLLDVKLSTGRPHQIRVHLATGSHPIIGDPVYLRRIPAVSKSLPPEVRAKLLDFPRQALHAASLAFAHPRTGEPLSFETEPPADFQDLIETLDTVAGLGADSGRRS